MSVRSAESARNSSCSFADRVARLSIDFYHEKCPKELLQAFNQTVVATIVMQQLAVQINHDEIDNLDQLEIISMGVGTKVVSGYAIMAHKVSAGSSGDELVRDSHAEVLARRGFIQFLYNQLSLCHDMTLSRSLMKDADRCIFQIIPGNGRPSLKPGVKFHLYTSSQPCGNASIKRWAKVKPLVYRNELSPSEFPQEPHMRIQITPESRQEGQVALLVKRNNPPRVQCDTTSESNKTPTNEVIQELFIPAGTALPRSHEGNVMTCSDKIALWNSLGLQGALLSALIDPVYLTTITVGRKFSQIHCQRALCCRLQDFAYPKICGKKGNNKKRKQGTQNLAVKTTDTLADEDGTKGKGDHVRTMLERNSEQKVDFSTHHPAMLGTQVKLDEGSIITATTTALTAISAVAGSSAVAPGGTTADSFMKTATAESTSTIDTDTTTGAAVGARFDEPRCLVVYMIPTHTPATDNNVSYVVEVLNGRTGALLSHSVQGSQSSDLTTEAENTPISSICSARLRSAFEAVYSLYMPTHERGMGGYVCDPSSLQYRALKTEVAPVYKLAKDSLLSDESTFAQWIRKDLF